MAPDPLSPVAPARIRALLVPVGRIKRSRFTSFVEHLQAECLVRLGDISPDPRPNRTMFSPLAFPNGVMLFEMSTSLPPSSHLLLSPFELFREPFLILGIADAKEHPWLKEEPGEADGSAASDERDQLPGADDLKNVVSDLREQYPQALIHSLLLFDNPRSKSHPWLPEETISVRPLTQGKTTTIKTLMCDLAAWILAELATLAKSIQALPTISSPSTPQGSYSGDARASPSEQPSGVLRRNSLIPGLSRSSSPSIPGVNGSYRASLPPHLMSSGANPAPDTRPISPPSGTSTPPPTTFDEMSGILDSVSSKPSSAAIARDAGREKFSFQGFGSGSVSERARNKGKGRVGIIIGTLYMIAGRWQDALRELTESAVRARSASDHLWHAKALEHILVCLLLCGWAGIDFQIPQICCPTADKSSSVKSPTHTPTGSMSDISGLTSPSGTSPASLHHLSAVVPDLVNMILSIYVRAANFTGEAMPQLSFSECVIRFAKILAAINLSGGALDPEALQSLVYGTRFMHGQNLSVSRVSINPNRNEIASLVFRALPPAPENSGLSPTDIVIILAGMASVLGSLGLQRKKAIVMKEFINILSPGLVHARKVGAAEMGVHPAAGLAALNMASGSTTGAGALNLGEDGAESGIKELLNMLGRIYGVPDAKATLPDNVARSDKAPAIDGVIPLILESLLQYSHMRSFGNINLKLDILRICIRFCEALPDLQGVLDFTAALLRTAGPGTAPSAKSTNVMVHLSREEQIRLAANISRTVAAAQHLGLQHIETDYWDDFFLRGVQILNVATPRGLIKHRKSELDEENERRRKHDSPFIHDPFLRKPDDEPVPKYIVAGEPYEFTVALQNPYEFDVDIEVLKLATEGVKLDAVQHNLRLGPYRTQKFAIEGVAREAGELRITGCIIGVKGCRERLFPIFVDPWRPEPETKIKRIGLNASVREIESRPASSESTQSRKRQPTTPGYPQPMTIPLTAIQPQPLAVVKKISLHQSAVMLLEGERKRFDITVQNISPTTAIDFLHISFQDSSTTALEIAMGNRDLSPAELYEIEVQLAHHSALRWILNPNAQPLNIAPGAEETFVVEIMGKPGLIDAAIQIDYANLGMPRDQVKEQFFTRQVFVPISVTVNASLQLHRVDIIPFNGDFAWTGHRKDAENLSQEPTHAIEDRYKPLLERIGLGTDDTDDTEHCMLLLDFRNAWPNPLSISLQVLPEDAPDLTDRPAKPDPWTHAYTTTDVIQPGHTARLVALVPKFYVAGPHAAVPSLNPANQRQFVVSAAKISPEAERSSRETFWFREQLLRRIRGHWTEEATGRAGSVELRALRLLPRMVDALRLDDVSIDMTVLDPTAGSAVTRTGRSRFLVAGPDRFLTLRTTLRNRSPRPIAPMLRLQPALADLPHSMALELDKKMAWSGVLQRPLAPLAPGEARALDLAVTPLCRGVFEWGCSVEEMWVWKEEEEDEGEEEGVEGGDAGEGNGGRKGRTRPRSDTGSLRDAYLGAPVRRMWFRREPCLLVVRDEEEGGW